MTGEVGYMLFIVMAIFLWAGHHKRTRLKDELAETRRHLKRAEDLKEQYKSQLERTLRVEQRKQKKVEGWAEIIE